jgi:hypothetical protein
MCSLSKENFWNLQLEAELLELSIAQGQDTPDTDARLAEVDRLMDQSDWSLSPDYGVIKTAVNGVPLKVLKSARGFYIGTRDDHHGPLSRESNEYWKCEKEAVIALTSGNWTQFDYDF